MSANMAMAEIPEGDMRRAAESSLMTLATLGFFQAMVKLNELQITKSLASEEKPEDVAKQIVEIRVQNRILRGLHDLGISIRSV